MSKDHITRWLSLWCRHFFISSICVFVTPFCICLLFLVIFSLCSPVEIWLLWHSTNGFRLRVQLSKMERVLATGMFLSTKMVVVTFSNASYKYLLLERILVTKELIEFLVRFKYVLGNVENGDTGDIATDHYHRYMVPSYQLYVHYDFFLLYSWTLTFSHEWNKNVILTYSTIETIKNLWFLNHK